jgi:hypothetical protein
MSYRNNIIAVSVAAFLAFPSFPGIAAADSAPEFETPKHVKTPFRLISDGGTDIRLPPSYILTEPTYKYLDLRLKTLEDNETRLTAENKELKEGATKKHWIYLGTIFVAGVLVGGYMVHKF